MKRVVVEHPYAARTKEEVEKNEDYGRACLAHSLSLGESPFSSALLYTQEGVLDDTIPAERRKGIEAGFLWREAAELTVFYGDRGITSGMEQGLEHAISIACPITFRSLGNPWMPEDPADWGEFSERAALEWLRLHPDVVWWGANRHGWMYQPAMMFGGVPAHALAWNVTEYNTELYIRHRGLLGSGRYYVDSIAVDNRLTEMAVKRELRFQPDPEYPDEEK